MCLCVTHTHTINVSLELVGDGNSAISLPSPRNHETVEELQQCSLLKNNKISSEMKVAPPHWLKFTWNIDVNCKCVKCKCVKGLLRYIKKIVDRMQFDSKLSSSADLRSTSRGSAQGPWGGNEDGEKCKEEREEVDQSKAARWEASKEWSGKEVKGEGKDAETYTYTYLWLLNIMRFALKENPSGWPVRFPHQGCRLVVQILAAW